MNSWSSCPGFLSTRITHTHPTPPAQLYLVTERVSSGLILGEEGLEAVRGRRLWNHPLGAPQGVLGGTGLRSLRSTVSQGQLPAAFRVVFVLSHVLCYLPPSQPRESSVGRSCCCSLGYAWGYTLPKPEAVHRWPQALSILGVERGTQQERQLDIKNQYLDPDSPAWRPLIPLL